MADANEVMLAKSVYEDLCAALDKKEWHYKRFDDDMVITFGVAGDDIPMNFILAVETERQLLRVISRLPFEVPEEKRMEMAIATCVASYGLADGNFDFDLERGIISFRLTASFRNSKIGEGLFDYLIRSSSFTVDLYNDKFLAIIKGFISISDFIASNE